MNNSVEWKKGVGALEEWEEGEGLGVREGAGYRVRVTRGGRGTEERVAV